MAAAAAEWAATVARREVLRRKLGLRAAVGEQAGGQGEDSGGGGGGGGPVPTVLVVGGGDGMGGIEAVVARLMATLGGLGCRSLGGGAEAAGAGVPLVFGAQVWSDCF